MILRLVMHIFSTRS